MALPRPAQPPRLPPAPSRVLESDAAKEQQRQRAEAAERRSMVRGLVLLALVVLIASIARAGLARVFPHGWWHR